MTLPELLEKARQLAAAGHVDAAQVKGLADQAEKANLQIQFREVSTEDYERAAATALAEMDGTQRALDRWRSVQQLLTSTRQELRLLQEGLFFIREEVERQVAIGTNKKAKAAREEARA